MVECDILLGLVPRYHIRACSPESGGKLVEQLNTLVDQQNLVAI